MSKRRAKKKQATKNKQAKQEQPKSEPKPVGRPSLYTEELALEICERIACGESLRQICKDEGMPDRVTIHRWLLTNEEFCNQYARAREFQAEYWADEILDIADDGQNDFIEREMQNGSVQVMLDKEAVMRSTLRVDTRKWLMSKLKRKKFGDKVTNEHVGKDGGPIRYEDMTPDERRKRIAELRTRDRERRGRTSRTPRTGTS